MKLYSKLSYSKLQQFMAIKKAMMRPKMLLNEVKQVIIWRERMGVEPTWDIFMPPDGFEVRGAHRDSAAPE
jgi:hypothetical protein